MSGYSGEQLGTALSSPLLFHPPSILSDSHHTHSPFFHLQILKRQRNQCVCMAAVADGKMVSRPQTAGQGPKENVACLDPPEETLERVPGQLAMLKKAQEFFQTCDAEGKGFIARSDMRVSQVTAGLDLLVLGVGLPRWR